MRMRNGMLSKELLCIDPKSTHRQIRYFISEKVRASRLKGAIVAVSGGIDSAVTLAMASRALGKEKVRALTMPERDITPSSDITDVIKLADALGVTCDIVEITPVISVIRSTLSYYDPSDMVSSGNILYKTQVRQLAKYIGIPRRFIEKTPTAGLWPGQTDEEELGIDYGTLDLILFGLERGMKASEISGDLGINTSVVERVLSRMRGSEHKRSLPLILRLSLGKR